MFSSTRKIQMKTLSKNLKDPFGLFKTAKNKFSCNNFKKSKQKNKIQESLKLEKKKIKLSKIKSKEKKMNVFFLSQKQSNAFTKKGDRDIFCSSRNASLIINKRSKQNSNNESKGFKCLKKSVNSKNEICTNEISRNNVFDIKTSKKLKKIWSTNHSPKNQILKKKNRTNDKFDTKEKNEHEIFINQISKDHKCKKQIMKKLLNSAKRQSLNHFKSFDIKINKLFPLNKKRKTQGRSARGSSLKNTKHPPKMMKTNLLTKNKIFNKNSKTYEISVKKPKRSLHKLKQR